ncbi:radical SAM protein [candidate division KSB1 bacterium]|nr:radical SAM protein [candidate division KSB1 bacterium]NIR73264.1 radical SAM protein [candidate division KSB1 bacterium]NIS26970.1 radical SAM protein [candidate division KSB1 bacterium]NIT73809.1 radical SAM protein [candidate division KSB1 bacterium]NIU27714.1 radical SAM protein [candidate division KSB1 bacterium]
MQEIPLKPLLRSITAKRLANAGLTISSYLLSALMRKPAVWGKPFILTVEPTNICNLKCPLCVTGNGRLTRPAGVMNFKTFKRIIDEVGDFLFYLLLYQQGEPFINNEFIRFVEYAKAKRIFVTTSTNGHFLTQETAKRAVASGIDSMIVSIDGADQDTYAKYRMGGRLSEVLTGVEHLVCERQRQSRRTPFVFIQFIAMQHNRHQISDMKKLVKNVGADKLLVKTAHVETVHEAKKWLPTETHLTRYRLEGDNLKVNRRGKGPCLRPWTSPLINWDGSVVPCCFDKNGHHTLGWLKQETDVEQIWTSKKYDTFRTNMLTNRNSLDICSNCSQGLRLFI